MTDVEERLNQHSPKEAMAYAKAWLERSPDSDEALQFYGLACAKQNDLKSALEIFKRLLKIDPNNAPYHVNLSNVYLNLGDIEQAQQHLYHALRLRPLHAETYNNLGRLYYKQGLFDKAAPHFEKALRLDHNCWEAHYNLANTFASQNQMHRAIPHYEEVARFCPQHKTALFNLGLACVEVEEHLKAEEYLHKTLLLDPDNTEAARQLGHIYVILGKTPEAIETFEKALALCPTLVDAHHNLAILYLRNQENEKALMHFTETLSLDPNNDTAKHMVAALSNDSQNTAPLDYITQLFDQYADHYNAHLKGKLKYNAPGLLRVAVGRCLNNNPKAGRVLDMGCGTGLCGIVFRDLALELIGIDLSSKMIEEAKKLDTYEKLEQTDLDSYLNQSTLKPFDLMIAGDVFVYTGDLSALFEKIAQKLVPDGLFAFTIELTTKAPFQLQPTGRFAHSTKYINSLSTSNQFTQKIEETVSLREHEGIPIKGMLYVLKKTTLEPALKTC